jgi:pimeloyl-ACP methyl ester carboxylesterase
VQTLRVEDPPPEECDHGPSHDVRPPRELVEPKSEKRLVPELRAAARTRDPDEILVRALALSFSAHDGPGRWRLARAMADLAVTGGMASELFADGAPTPADLAGLAARRLPGVPADDGALRVHAAGLLDRAGRVRELLRLSGEARRLRRRQHPELEPWLAVSGEDDPPPWPVNVPTSPHPTHFTRVRVGDLELRVRYAWAGPPDGSAPLVLLLHGHSSKLEEYDRLVARLAAKTTPSGAPKYCVTVPDLPSCGYTTRVEHEDVADVDAPGAPILDFLERFAARFVETVCAERGVAPRVACVGGGSLGGNLALRLAERRAPWARRFVAWSPASVWSSMQGDLIKGCALDRTKDRMVEEESAESRRRYFREVFADTICATGKTQPQMWYRDRWPCRPRSINRALWDRREIYGPEYRRWHWRVAHEQLVFSHVETRNGRAPWQTIAGPVLLVAGAHDNYRWTHIHDRTCDLGRYLTSLGVPGHCVLMARTGHSIHDERPQLLADHIDAFVDAHR